jgi:SulP family sulfate permease
MSTKAVRPSPNLLIREGLAGVVTALALIPMMVVALKTMSWQRLRWSTSTRAPIPETGLMVVTVAITIWTSNLAIGVVVGVVLARVLGRQGAEESRVLSG